jgi:hypothetical protein
MMSRHAVRARPAGPGRRATTDVTPPEITAHEMEFPGIPMQGNPDAYSIIMAADSTPPPPHLVYILWRSRAK